MKKVGSILQAYSTCFFISKLNYKCNILQVQYVNSFSEKLKKIFRNFFKCIGYRNYYQDRKKMRETSKKEINLLSYNTKNEMDNFIQTVFEVQYVNSNELDLLNNSYDYFIVGSDQIWNGYDDFRYLTFADQNKRIALAPSFGSSNIKDYYKSDIAKALKKFSVLSSREESGVALIKNLSGKEAMRLPDPTLFLSKEEWIQFSTKGICKKNFILLHFLNKPSDLAINTINEYLKERECTVYCICNKYDEYKSLLRFEFIDINPYDYIALINKADFIFTDSFHSTLFSLNLETQFFTFERQYLHEISQSSRIIDLLSRLNMVDRYIIDERKDFINLECWNSDQLFEIERDNLKKYLREALEN